MMRFLRILFMRLTQKAMTSSALMYSTVMRFHLPKTDNSVPIHFCFSRISCLCDLCGFKSFLFFKKQPVPGDQIVERWRKIEEEKLTRSTPSESRALLSERLQQAILKKERLYCFQYTVLQRFGVKNCLVRARAVSIQDSLVFGQARIGAGLGLTILARLFPPNFSSWFFFSIQSIDDKTTKKKPPKHWTSWKGDFTSNGKV